MSPPSSVPGALSTARLNRSVRETTHRNVLTAAGRARPYDLVGDLVVFDPGQSTLAHISARPRVGRSRQPRAHLLPVVRGRGRQARPPVSCRLTWPRSAIGSWRFPEYPTWADPTDSPVRWYAGPGKLLRQETGWIFVRGQTPEDLRALCATIPGDWTLAHNDTDQQ